MPRLTRIAPELPAYDLEASLDYYQQKLGFQIAMAMHDRGYVVIERDDIAIHLFEDKAHSHSPVDIHIFTTKIEDLYAELQQRGSQFSQEIVRKPWGNRDFRLRDPADNELKFTEPLPDAD